MDIDGTRMIGADRATVWQRINDPAIMKACIPGCTEFTGNPVDGYHAVIVQAIGPLKATFRGTLRIENVVPGESYTLIGHGEGGIAGHAGGRADVTLADADSATQMTYRVSAHVGGRLERIGTALVGGVASRIADRFFERFVAVVESGGLPAD